MFSAFYFICHPAIKYLDEGIFIDRNLYMNVKESFLEALLIWPIFMIYSHIVYFIQRYGYKRLTER